MEYFEPPRKKHTPTNRLYPTQEIFVGTRLTSCATFQVNRTEGSGRIRNSSTNVSTYKPPRTQISKNSCTEVTSREKMNQKDRKQATQGTQHAVGAGLFVQVVACQT